MLSIVVGVQLQRLSEDRRVIAYVFLVDSTPQEWSCFQGSLAIFSPAIASKGNIVAPIVKAIHSRNRDV
jgi:hypothetical protein